MIFDWLAVAKPTSGWDGRHAGGYHYVLEEFDRTAVVKRLKSGFHVGGRRDMKTETLAGGYYCFPRGGTLISVIPWDIGKDDSTKARCTGSV